MPFLKPSCHKWGKGLFSPCAAAPGGMQGLHWFVEPCAIWAGNGLLPCAGLIGYMFPEEVWCIKILLALAAGIDNGFAFGGLRPVLVFSGFVGNKAIIIICSIVTSLTFKLILSLVDGSDVLPQR